MKLKDYFKTRPGARTQLAEAVGVRPVYLSQLAGGHGNASAELAIAIEKATSGQVSCEDIRPDVEWWVLRKGSPPSLV